MTHENSQQAYHVHESPDWLEHLSPELRERLDQAAADIAASRGVSLEVATQALNEALRINIPRLVDDLVGFWRPTGKCPETCG